MLQPVCLCVSRCSSLATPTPSATVPGTSRWSTARPAAHHTRERWSTSAWTPIRGQVSGPLYPRGHQGVRGPPLPWRTSGGEWTTVPWRTSGGEWTTVPWRTSGGEWTTVRTLEDIRGDPFRGDGPQCCYIVKRCVVV